MTNYPQAARVGLLSLAGLYASESATQLWARRLPGLCNTIDQLVEAGWRCDFLLLAGDLTERGRYADFLALQRMLAPLLGHLLSRGFEPMVLAVPGPSDLGTHRSRLGRYAVRSELQSGENEEAARQALYESFAPFMAYCRELPRPNSAHAFSSGAIPGDFYARLTTRGLPVGVVGFNTNVALVRPDATTLPDWRAALLARADKDALTIALLPQLDDLHFTGLGEALARHGVSVTIAHGKGPSFDGTHLLTVPSFATAHDQKHAVEARNGCVAALLEIGDSDARLRSWPIEWQLSRVTRPLPFPDTSWEVVRRRGNGSTVTSERVPVPSLGSLVQRHFGTAKSVAELTRATLRNRGELEDFIDGHFPEVSPRFRSSMTYEAGLRLLLESVEPSRVVSTLAESFPRTVRQSVHHSPVTGSAATSRVTYRRFPE